MKELLKYRELLLERFAQETETLAEMLAALPGSLPANGVEGGDAAPLPEHAEIEAILMHLCQMEADIFLPRIEGLGRESASVFVGWPYDLSAAEGDCSSGWMQAGEACTGMRQREMDLLRRVDPAAWNRQDRHPAWGMRTLQWWVEGSLAHLREHLQELRLVLSSESGMRADRQA